MRRFVIAVRCTGAGVAAGARMHRSATIQGRLLVGLVLPLVALTSCGPSPVDDSGSGSNEGPLKASLVLDSAQPHLQAGGLTEVSVSRDELARKSFIACNAARGVLSVGMLDNVPIAENPRTAALARRFWDRPAG